MAAELIAQTIRKLQSLASWPTQSYWSMSQVSGTVPKQFEAELADIPAVSLTPAIANDKGYLVFERGLKLAWFTQTITIPAQLNGYDVSGLNVRLNLTWWAESAQIFVNGKLACEGDLFDSSTRLLLSEAATPGDHFEVAIALVSPAHDIGALMKSALMFESPNLDHLEPGSFAVEVELLAKYLGQHHPTKLEVLSGLLTGIPWSNVENTIEFNAALGSIRSQWEPLTIGIKAHQFHVLGHAHLDMAWLWTSDETWAVGERTFRSVVDLQQQFPELIFGHTSPALYEWIEQHRPELWQDIQAAVKSGRWELLGGMWVEPEVNLLSGESIIRQFLYGQDYFQQKFGQRSTVAWLPDTFGFPQQLPQLAHHCGIKAFGTGKLHWNDTAPFPHGLFRWRSPDNTELLTLMTPPNVTGIMDTNPITMVDYGLKWSEQTGLQDIFWLPGVGDHGGGPTKDMLQVARKWQDSPCFPALKFSRVADFLAQVGKHRSSLPVWDDELYLELHRGTYTIHRDQKVFNARCERLLRQVELWGAIAQNLPEPPITPIADPGRIKALWKKVLFNQFHDILPGTSIPEVFAEANEAWQAVIEVGESFLENALQAIAAQIDRTHAPDGAHPLLLFNDLNWERGETITLPISEPMQVRGAQGNLITPQIIHRETPTSPLVVHFQAQVPAVGYSLYWLIAAPDAAIETGSNLASRSPFRLENDYLQVEIDPKTGEIAQLFDKTSQRSLLQGPGNELQAFEDKGQYWDAWDIAPDYETKPVEPAQLLSISWRERNPVREVIRVRKRLNHSDIIQDYRLDRRGKWLQIQSNIDWQEEQVVLKAAFPFDVSQADCTYETPCGAIRRSPGADPAKWEVPALRWADFHNETYGVSLLTRQHHGYDATPNQIRLSLLKSPLWPDPQSDRGPQTLCYGIYPHPGSWQAAGTVRTARSFNSPLRRLWPQNSQANGSLPAQHSFLQLEGDSLVLLALKQAESLDRYVLRFYEAHGEISEFKLNNSLSLSPQASLNGLEDNREEALPIQVYPWKVHTIELQPSEKS